MSTRNQFGGRPQRTRRPGGGARPDRRSAYKPAVLHLPDGERIDCVITDVSAGGARARFSHAPSLPRRLRLACPVLRLDCDADVVWTDGRDAGLKLRR